MNMREESESSPPLPVLNIGGAAPQQQTEPQTQQQQQQQPDEMISMSRQDRVPQRQYKATPLRNNYADTRHQPTHQYQPQRATSGVGAGHSLERPQRNQPSGAYGARYGGATNSNNYYGKGGQPVRTSQPGMGKQQYQQQHQHQQQQYYPQDSSQLPVYVPPFLLERMKEAQGTLHRQQHPHNQPLDYLPWSIANIFLCVIIALPALFFSIQTRDLKRAGDLKRAKLNSRRSLVLNITASIVGMSIILLAVILRFALYQLIINNDIQYQNVPIMNEGR